MLRGKITQELIDACEEYERLHDGMGPDHYDDIEYEDLTYEMFLTLILEANNRKCDLLDLL